MLFWEKKNRNITENRLGLHHSYFTHTKSINKDSILNLQLCLEKRASTQRSDCGKHMVWKNKHNTESRRGLQHSLEKPTTAQRENWDCNILINQATILISDWVCNTLWDYKKQHREHSRAATFTLKTRNKTESILEYFLKKQATTYRAN